MSKSIITLFNMICSTVITTASLVIILQPAVLFKYMTSGSLQQRTPSCQQLCSLTSVPYNFSDSAILWFKSYLEGRTQIVQVETKFSDPEHLGDYAMPQGSILAPLIFLIFNNGFPGCSEEGESVLYADDDTVNVRAKDVTDLKEKVQHEADRATDWVSDNRMVC